MRSFSSLTLLLTIIYPLSCQAFVGRLVCPELEPGYEKYLQNSDACQCGTKWRMFNLPIAEGICNDKDCVGLTCVYTYIKTQIAMTWATTVICFQQEVAGVKQATRCSTFNFKTTGPFEFIGTKECSSTLDDKVCAGCTVFDEIAFPLAIEGQYSSGCAVAY